MEDSLAVAADERDFLLWNPELAASGESGVARVRQAKIQLLRAGSNGELFGHPKNFLPKRKGNLTEV